MPGAIGSRLRTVVHVLGALFLGEIRRSARESPDAEQRRAKAVRQALEKLGPFYIKMGQILATRPDLVPQSMIPELENLHDQVDVQPFSFLEPVLEQDLGSDWKRYFDDIDVLRPLGAASIAQVHQATLTNGRQVVLKIQRPGIRASVRADMTLLRQAGRLLCRSAPRFAAVVDLDAMLASVFDAIESELDFTGEAANIERAEASVRRFATLRVPEVLHAGPHVLVQSLADGVSIRKFDRGSIPSRGREAIGRDLLAHMYRGYFIDRFFHADPHSGNVIVSPDGTATVIDWGMVGRLDKRTSMYLTLVLLAMVRNDGYSLANAWTAMGRATPWADLPGFSADMAALTPKMVGASLEKLNFGAALTSVLEKASRRGIASAPCTSLLGKSFGNLEGSVRHLAPEVVVGDVFQQEFQKILRHVSAEFLSPQQFAVNWMETMTGGTAALEQLRSFTSDVANHSLSLQVQTMHPPRAPRASGDDRSRGYGRLLPLAAAAYLLGRRKRC